MSAPRILYDATYLVTQLRRKTPAGIRRVDLGYASELAARPDTLCAGLSYGWPWPRVLSPARLGELAARLTRRWEGEAATDDPAFSTIRNFLITGAAPAEVQARRRTLGEKIQLAAERLNLLGIHDGRFNPPRGAVYLNTAQYRLEVPLYFRWLKARPDVKPVFLLHDLLPLDYPQFFKPEEHGLFVRRLETVRRLARGLIVTCEATKLRVARHFAENHTATIPIHVQHLPPDARFSQSISRDPALAAAPYMVMVGTLEPRKNHRLLLDLWRGFAREGRAAPRLLIVGAVGWKCEAILDALKQPELAGRVLHVASLGDAAYRYFLGHARALLQPSVMEGYGLPLAEAAAAGIPVIASDLGVFREVCQGQGEFIAPSDESAWRHSILDLLDAEAFARRRQAMAAYRAPDWKTYMDGVLDFLSKL